MLRLAISVENIAAMRDAGGRKEPDPAATAVLAETSGADGIYCHLREDRKHIKERDLFILKEMVKSHFNIGISPTEEMIKIAMKANPDMVTLVPQLKEEHSPEGGINIELNFERIANITDRLRANGIIVSYFIDPEVEQLKASAKAGADYIEINTGMYARAKDAEEEAAELHKIISIAHAGSKLGLGLNAGRGLNYYNIVEIAEISQIEELNVGHSIMAKALMVGIDRAVKDMLQLIR